MRKKGRFCFVISPIGEEGSDIRTHADIVFDCIIKPACAAGENERRSYSVERGDHKAAPGKITDQIYEDILQADIIVAVLTGGNPNVYYELAIAQAAAKPVILLLEKGYSPPFDVKDQRIIYYDFEPHAIFHGVYVEQLKAAIAAIAKNRAKPTVSFAPHLEPLGDRRQSIGEKGSDAEEDCLAIVSEADRYIHLLGYSLLGWTRNGSFENTLKARSGQLTDGLKVCLLSSHNPSLAPSMRNPDTVKTAGADIKAAPELWAKFLQQIELKPRSEVRTNKLQNISYQVVMSEKEAIVIPYLTSRETTRSPYIFAKAQTPFYDAIREEFDHLWNTSEPFEIDSSPSSAKAKKRARGTTKKK